MTLVKVTDNIPANSIASQLVPNKARALPVVIRALTGCDDVSSFCGKGKNSVWESWNVFTEITTTFNALIIRPQTITDEFFKAIERYIVVIYSRTCSYNSVNEARRYMLSQGTRTLENIPSTEDDLKQHIRKATYKAGYIWGVGGGGCP